MLTVAVMTYNRGKMPLPYLAIPLPFTFLTGDGELLRKCQHQRYHQEDR